MASGVFFGLTAALCWGVADVFMRGASRRAGVFLTLLFTEMVALAGLLLFAAPLGLLTATQAPLGAVLAAAALNLLILVGAVLLYRAFAVGTLALVSPLAASFAAVATILALLSGERPSLLAGIGLAITLIGVTVASIVPTAASAPAATLLATTPPIAAGRAAPVGEPRAEPTDRLFAVPSAPSGSATTLVGGVALAIPATSSPSAHMGRRAGWFAPGVLEVLVAVVIFGVAYWALRYVTPTVGGVRVAFIGKVVDLLALLALAGIAALIRAILPRLGRTNDARGALCASVSQATMAYRLRWPPRRFWLFVIPGALLDTAANVAYNIGVIGALTSVVVTLSSLFSAVTVALAWAFLKERLVGWQWVGVAAILAGVALINWGG